MHINKRMTLQDFPHAFCTYCLSLTFKGLFPCARFFEVVPDWFAKYTVINITGVFQKKPLFGLFF